MMLMIEKPVARRLLLTDVCIAGPDGAIAHVVVDPKGRTPAGEAHSPGRCSAVSAKGSGSGEAGEHDVRL